MRLDQRLVASGLATSRARAQELIRAGQVAIDGVAASKPSQIPDEKAVLSITGEVRPWVSRGALKLEHALDRFEITPTNRVVLDLGASTGGFTQVCLARGATKVYAVDVGRGQLHPEIAADPRVVEHSGVNAKDLDIWLAPEPIELLVADLSFISLAKALPAPLALTAPRAQAVLLVKPQFEVGPDRVGKGGIVKDAAARAEAATDVATWLQARGWRILGECVSPILGGDGNEERLLAAEKR